MSEDQLCNSLPLEKQEYRERLALEGSRLEAVPGSFHAAAWMHSFGYAYISRSVSQVLGYPYGHFQENGIVFLQAITPPALVHGMFQELQAQKAAFDGLQDLTQPFYFDVYGALLQQDEGKVPVRFIAMALDYQRESPGPYFLLSSWLRLDGMEEAALGRSIEEIKQRQWAIKQLYIAASPGRFRQHACYTRISEREKQVGALISSGFSTREISDRLSISFYTVETHRKNLLKKLEARNTAELVAILKNETVV